MHSQYLAITMQNPDDLSAVAFSDLRKAHVIDTFYRLMDIGYIAIAHALVLSIIGASFTAYTLLYKYVFFMQRIICPDHFTLFSSLRRQRNSSNKEI